MNPGPVISVAFLILMGANLLANSELNKKVENIIETYQLDPNEEISEGEKLKLVPAENKDKIYLDLIIDAEEEQQIE